MGKKHEAYKSSFKYKVQLRKENEGWTVFPICDSDLPVNLLCRRIRSDGKEETEGIRVKAHGHIYRQERDALIALGKALHISILYVHESQEREPVFTVLWRQFR